MSSTINASTASGGGVITTADASGVLQLQTAGTTALTIDASQNVGIGTSSPSYKLDIVSGDATAGLGYALRIRANTTAAAGSLQFTDNAATVQYAVIAGDSSSNLKFYSGLSEKMRIDSSGNLLVGTTSALFASSHDFVNSGSAVLGLRNSGATAGLYWQVGPDSNSSFKVYNASNVGVFLSNGATAWASSSDERLKTDLIPIENGVNKVVSLRAVTGRFKTDDEDVSRAFLIAQDVQKVLPEAVSTAADGTLALAYTEVIPLLVASIKELKAIIDTQNARIEALEAKI